MSRGLLALLILSASVPAAPLPKAAPKKFENFGTVAEVKGVKCESARPGELRVSLSADAASDTKEHGEVRPNFTRTVEGDFVLTVRITHTPPDDKNPAAVENGETIAAAGIALCKPDGKRGSLVVLNRLSKGRDGWDTYFKLSALYETTKARGSIGALSSHHTFANAPVYLRLTRRGDKFTATQSDDGKEWAPVFEEPHEVPGLGPVAIGPVAVHNTNTAYDVTFDEYTLTTPPEKKK
ncbi:DUF1349 domain-containing protein [Limnoglobus roseus]|uniref:Beta-xylosidase C-terminal Concanavalin A-like domain-containing protein n=1 Tax=Limnoglobus roseus TaxID=2598579 RepID=A0A5C1AVE2_9BACT|nr:DUF1349 domain-containing protein [Limnoglobus roseus]QEL20778.1 hypothetical protein PX52LOC_07894 [Limnoglobus roseus]